MRRIGTQAHAARASVATSLAIVLAAATHGRATPKLDEWLPQLQKGWWVNVEGEWENGVLRAEEIKVARGEFDQWEVGSIIVSIDSTARRFRTQVGVDVVTTPATEFQRLGNELGFEDLQPGMMVEADGQLQRDGSLLADEVEIKPRGEERRSAAKPDEHELTGRIDTIDAAAHSLTVLGVTVQCDEHTRNKTRLLH